MARDPLDGQREPRRRGERLLALTVAGMLALNYPLAALFSAGRTLLGIPLIAIYLFCVWGLLIALSAVIIEGGRRGGRRRSRRTRR